MGGREESSVAKESAIDVESHGHTRSGNAYHLIAEGRGTCFSLHSILFSSLAL